MHSDRSGRVFLSADYGAAALDGAAPQALERAAALPEAGALVPLADRPAIGIDRRGHPRPLGRARWALAAVLGSTSVRTHLPACEIPAGVGPLEPLPYSAVGAREGGDLVVAALAPATPVGAADGLAERVGARLRAEPANRALRQLARCARDYGCPFARNAFLGRDEAALPLGAPGTDAGAPLVAPRRRDERAPLVPGALRAPGADAAAVAVAHLAGGGAAVSFGHACEGEPLGMARTVADVAARIRARSGGPIRLRTAGSSAAALARVIEAGVDEVAVALASARPATYERVHRPAGYRWSDVRSALRIATEKGAALTIELLLLPGLTDRAAEADALLELLGELPPGTALRYIDLSADPYALLARLPRDDATIGIDALLARIAADASHVRRAA